MLPMGTNTLTSLVLLLTVALLAFSSSAHNITRLLSNYPAFSSFNSLLSSAGLADEINGRQTITVLAVSNPSIGTASGLGPEVLRHILSVNVVLDYFDLEKLSNLKGGSTILTTLFQTSGIAEGRTGFLNVTKQNGRISFSSAAPGSALAADLVGPVAARPYNLSVLQVSSLIIPPGVADLSNSSATPTTPSKPPTAEAPVVAASPEEDAPVAEAVPAGAPAEDAPVAEASPASEPVAEAAPVGAPTGEAPEGVADEEESKSGAGRMDVGASLWVFLGGLLVACL